ncbi:hypothetical protein [Campylobacter peloridis]|nr:hypothetical protein [Campylobacter peloridis]
MPSIFNLAFLQANFIPFILEIFNQIQTFFMYDMANFLILLHKVDYL